MKRLARRAPVYDDKSVIVPISANWSEQVMEIIPRQLNYRPVVRTVAGNVDCTRFERGLKRIDELLRLSRAEEEYVRRSLAGGKRGSQEADLVW